MATNYGAVPNTPVPKRGRAKGHIGTNQYTGKRGQNIEYVRRILKYFLEAERAKGSPLTPPILSACRLLLMCENVFIAPRRQKTSDALSNVGEQVKEGQIGLPELLKEVSLAYEEDTGGNNASAV
jgi:hypothetical protein